MNIESLRNIARRSEKIATAQRHVANELANELARAEAARDPLGLHIYHSRAAYRRTAEGDRTKSGKRTELALFSSYQEAVNLGFKGPAKLWTLLMQSGVSPEAFPKEASDTPPVGVDRRIGQRHRPVMCGRYTLSAPELLAEILQEIEDERLLAPRYNIAPQMTVPVILNDSPQRLSSARWGLVPFWSKTDKLPYATLNAKCETVVTSSVYREPFKRRHCLIPADGFYEWQKPDAKIKIPHRFQRADGGLFYFAGLWDVWRASEEAPPLRTVTIITTTPNATVAPVHNRMPVILRREDEQRWLSLELPKEERQAMLAPYPDPMQLYKVSPRVGKVQNQDAALIDRLVDPALPLGERLRIRRERGQMT